jgi:DNA repair exonuclease SbcCD nuclease subunit
MAEFVDHVRNILAQKVPYVYLLGNHDMYKPNDSRYHALLPIKGTMKDFHVIDQVTNMYDITFVPYCPDPAAFPSSTLPICVAHQTFKGADYGDITTKDGVDADGVDAHIIISGHIHKRQSLGSKVIYPGSPFSQSVNDVNQVKGLLLFDTDTYGQQFIPCPLPMWRALEFELTSTTTATEMHAMLQQTLNTTDHWVIKIKGPKPEVLAYIDSKEYKEVVKGKDVKFRPDFTDKEKRQIKIEALSMEKIISEYVTKIYSGSLDKTQLESSALEILKTVRQA